MPKVLCFPQMLENREHKTINNFINVKATRRTTWRTLIWLISFSINYYNRLLGIFQRIKSLVFVKYDWTAKRGSGSPNSRKILVCDSVHIFFPKSFKIFLKVSSGSRFAVQLFLPNDNGRCGFFQPTERFEMLMVDLCFICKT